MQAWEIRVKGQVQGVGFRPFIWRLAREHGAVGHVLNDAGGVLIHLQGVLGAAAFAAAIKAEAPPLAKIASIECKAVEPIDGVTDFQIALTQSGSVRTDVAPDARICPVCLSEVRDRSERRFGYAFANCTHCGPRFTIIETMPYDRASTTMSAFPMCDACRAEYLDPTDRRFHAQPIACAHCGPRLWLEVGGVEQPGAGLSEAAARLRSGQILAIKALGGFHLACDATNEQAVKRLRDRKRRPTKPFALMAPDLATIESYASVSETEAELLQSAPSPIVLLKNGGGESDIAPSVAPGQWTTGWMVPPTPLHALLLDTFGGPLVMTSGNRSGEPQAKENSEARAKLGPYVDAFVMHDREIARRLDDSVAMVVGDRTRLQRRARGYAPSTLALPPGFDQSPEILAVGGHLKSSICLVREGNALLSHHLGDLDDPLTYEEFVRANIDYADLFQHRPKLVACDLHEGYRSSQFAAARTEELGVDLVPVQHHHAHIAAVMADHGWPLEGGPVIGIALDGLGLGDDGTIWGGEFLLADYRAYQRIGYLKPVALPGGDQAQREPWRNLLAQLDAAGLSDWADELSPGRPLAPLRAAIAAGVNAPLSSSAGRLFDAFAAAIGIAQKRQSFEGEAAMAMEAIAHPHIMAVVQGDDGYMLSITGGALDPAPLWRALKTDMESELPAGVCAAKFHVGLAKSVCQFAREAARAHSARAIALSGGVFQNRILLNLCLDYLADLTVLSHTITPPNDGSIALGQAIVTAANGISPNENTSSSD